MLRLHHHAIGKLPVKYLYFTLDKLPQRDYTTFNELRARRATTCSKEVIKMPQISINVSQEVYNLAKANSARYGDVTLANAVRKLITCYAKRVLYFNGLLPELNTAKLDEYLLELYGEDAPKAEVIAPVDPVDPSEVGVTQLYHGITIKQLLENCKEGMSPTEEMHAAIAQTGGAEDWTYDSPTRKWVKPAKEKK